MLNTPSVVFCHLAVHLREVSVSVIPVRSPSCIFLTLVQVWKDKERVAKKLRLFLRYYTASFPKLKKVQVTEKSKIERVQDKGGLHLSYFLRPKSKMREKNLMGRETINYTWFWIFHSKKCNLGQICNNIVFSWLGICMVILILYITYSFSSTFFSVVFWLPFTAKNTPFYTENKGRNGIVQEAVIIMVVRRDCHIWNLLFHQNCPAHSQIQTEFGHTDLTMSEVTIAEHR